MQLLQANSACLNHWPDMQPKICKPAQAVMRAGGPSGGQHLGVGGGKLRVVAVGLRDEDHESLLGVDASPHHELCHVVQVGAVALGHITEGQELPLPSLPNRVLQGVLPRCHPVQVALQGVDLACSTDQLLSQKKAQTAVRN